MSEDLFEALFKPFGKAAHLHKLTDSKEVNGRRKGREFLLVKNQPADYILTFKGATCYAEVKGSLDPTSFPFKNIRPKQMAHARMITAAGGAYFFFIRRGQTDRWFKVPPNAILDHHAKSMSWGELLPYAWSPT